MQLTGNLGNGIFVHAGPLPTDAGGAISGGLSALLLPKGSCLLANNIVDGSRGNNLELLNVSPDVLDNTLVNAGSVGMLVHGVLAEPTLGPGNKVSGSKLSGIEIQDQAKLRLVKRLIEALRVDGDWARGL